MSNNFDLLSMMHLIKQINSMRMDDFGGYYGGYPGGYPGWQPYRKHHEPPPSTYYMPPSYPSPPSYPMYQTPPPPPPSYPTPAPPSYPTPPPPSYPSPPPPSYPAPPPPSYTPPSSDYKKDTKKKSNSKDESKLTRLFGMMVVTAILSHIRPTKSKANVLVPIMPIHDCCCCSYNTSCCPTTTTTTTTTTTAAPIEGNAANPGGQGLLPDLPVIPDIGNVGNIVGGVVDGVGNIVGGVVDGVVGGVVDGVVGGVGDIVDGVLGETGNILPVDATDPQLTQPQRQPQKYLLIKPSRVGTAAVPLNRYVIIQKKPTPQTAQKPPVKNHYYIINRKHERERSESREAPSPSLMSSLFRRNK